MKNNLKSQIQKQAAESIYKTFMNNKNSIVTAATGFGKTKTTIELIKLFIKRVNKNPKILIITPTEELRDNGWKDEFKKWRKKAIYDLFVSTTCYASLTKIDSSTFDLIIADEAHNLTEANSKNIIGIKSKLLLLTATPPKDIEKKAILAKLNIENSFDFPLDEAVNNELVSDYEIEIIEFNLNDNAKQIKLSKKSNRLVTEKFAYDYFDKLCKATNNSKMATIKRMKVIYELPSKTSIINFILSNLIGKEDRKLIFCSNIEQSELVSTYSYHSKSKSKSNLELFKNKKINTLSCVKALNEGVNISDVDYAIITQCNSNERNLIQQIGRCLRGSKKAKIYIICAKNTQDETWVNLSIANLNPSKIKRINFNYLLTLY